MTKFAIAAAAVLGVVLLAGGRAAAEPVKSGPQAGDKVPGPFRPLNVTGAQAGEKYCLYCHNGFHPVAMIFAREVTPGLVSLIKKIDAATAAHEEQSMGSFVVFLNDSSDLPKTLKELAEKEGIKHTVLAIYAPAGPPAYKIAADADVTAILYTKATVKANHAFRKGELNDTGVAAVLANLPKIFAEE